MRVRSLLAVGSTVLFGAIAGCGADKVVGVSEDELFGTWSMVSSGGQPLPATTIVDDCAFSVISEDLAFNNDLTFTITSVTSLACGGGDPEPSTEQSSGTYRVANGRLSLLFEGDFIERSLPVGVTGSRLTLTIVQDGASFLLVYERQ